MADFLQDTDEELLFQMREAQKDNEIESAGFITVLISRYMKVIIMKAGQMAKGFTLEYEDLISEGFVGLLSAVRNYNEEKGAFSTFANICIENKMKSHLSVTKRIPKKAEGFDFNSIKDGSPLADDLLIEKENENEFLEKIRGVLSGFEYDVLTLFLSGFTYRQISEKVGVSIKSVDNALVRARGKLKEFKSNPNT